MDAAIPAAARPGVKRAAGPTHAALARALAKRAKRAPRREDAAELLALLLPAAAAVDGGRGAEGALRAAEKELSPRVVEILAVIAGAGARWGPADGGEDDGDAVGNVWGGGEKDAGAKSDQCVPGSALVAKTDQCVPDGVPSASAVVERALSDESLTESEGSEAEEAEVARVVAGEVAVEVAKPIVDEGVVGGSAYKQETEIALSRIFDLGKAAPVEDPSVPPFAPYSGPSVVSMTGFGELGRFGNQVLQYAFLRVYQRVHGIDEVQVPAWVGAGLFGLGDRTVQRAFPAVVETREAKANSTFTGEFMDYIKASNAGREVAEVEAADLLRGGRGGNELRNVDFWGWFQWHSSCYAPHKALIQEVFSPVPAIEAPMMEQFNRNLRFKGGVRRTVVGLHLRLGDYQNISASSFGYCAPTSWYLELLEKLWPTLENPVLFVASDDLDAVLRDFSAYSPVTADAAGIVLPPAAEGLKAGFFPDWWSLTQCDVLAISNSTFSFSACMMNTVPGARFYRAHYADRMVAIDPWAADPIVHRDMSGNSLATAVDTLKVVYNTQGTRGLMRNVLYELPYYGIRSAIMKAVLWKNARENQAKLGETETPAGLTPVSMVTA